MMKFKKVISMLMATTMIFTLGACGGGAKTNESVTTSDTQKSGKYKVAFILNCSINDGGWHVTVSWFQLVKKIQIGQWSIQIICHKMDIMMQWLHTVMPDLI